MVLLLDPSGELLEINAAGERLLGARREALLGRNVRDFLAPGDGPRIDAVFALLASDGYAEYLDGHALTRQTELVPVDIRFSSVEVGGSRLVQGVVHDLSAQRLRESQRLREEAALRDALVREVHHRIKNSLQGITGFLRSLARHHVALAPALDEVVGQVRSIAIVHGLYARRSGARVMLCDLVSDIAHNIESLWRTELTIDMPAEGLPFCVAEEETVPLALVLNELLANAVKHRGAAAPPEIRVGPCGPVGEVCVCIVNRGRLPAGFDFARGHALGTGLSLVARLLPRHGAELAWREGAEESPGEDTVTVSLTLSAPVLVDVACLEEQGNG
jgi:PAS domain S-box-containing protein